jgi:hypothetical protein
MKSAVAALFFLIAFVPVPCSAQEDPDRHGVTLFSIEGENSWASVSTVTRWDS